MRFSILFRTAFAAVLSLGMAASAQAALVQVSVLLPESSSKEVNDCSGLFGTAPNCNVLGPTGTEFSPLVVKYDMDDAGTTAVKTTINKALFPSFSGPEIGLSFSGPDGNGTWTYAQDTGDPSIKYWTAKAGTEFNLFWMVDAAELVTGTGACANNLFYTDACLAKAQVQTSGGFFTPGNKKLSHIGLYDTAAPPVPLPAAAWLLLSGLGGLGLLGRRRKVG